ncbi:unnamed protein product, partial [Laminaria digitata]
FSFFSFFLISLKGSALKGRIQITFTNQHGVEEAGIDGGGVFKEYMDCLTKRAFDPQYALFLATEDQVFHTGNTSHMGHFSPTPT